MSIKTLRKRIALVAVSALGAGLMSVVAVPSANSAISFARGEYDVASSFKACSAVADDASADSGQTGEYLVGGSVSFEDTTNGGPTMTAVGDKATFALSGNASFTAVTAGTAATPVYSGSGKTITTTAATTSATSLQAFTITFDAVGAVQLAISHTTAAGVTTDVELYTITVSATCAAGVPSVANSFVKVSFYANAASASVPSSNVTDSRDAVATAGSASLAESAAKIANGGKAYIDVRIMDGKSTPAIVTTAGIFGASATNGAVVSWSDSSALQSSSDTEAVAAGNQFNRLSVWQGLANENKAMSTTVTITYNGVVYGTRTITFTGKASKISILPAYSSIGKAGVTAKFALAYEIQDAAGNNLTSDGPGITGASSSGDQNDPLLATSDVILDANQGVVTDAAAVINTQASGYYGTTDVTCGVKGKADVQLKYTFSDLTSLVSNTYSFACAGGPVNYKASLDKASYQPGEIATLTITATDSAGNPVYDLDASAAGNDLGDTSDEVSISLPQMTAVTAPTNTDEFAGGKKTYKFTVGTTEGSFSGIVDLPKYNSTTYAQTAQTIAYKVASAPTGAVTNAEVLAAIVKLIASINKQIRALQKSLRR